MAKIEVLILFAGEDLAEGDEVCIINKRPYNVGFWEQTHVAISDALMGYPVKVIKVEDAHAYYSKA
jgi:hypothetical protein